MRALRLLGAVMLAAIALGSASACQVALRAEGEDARCEPNGIKCGPGLTCKAGVCRPCTPRPEECNFEDDDCDGEVDEDFDRDGDGFKQCGVAGQLDCNDNPGTGGALIFPGQPELCNGYDDNCDGRTDEEPNDCPVGKVCFASKGECIDKDDCRYFGCTMGGCNVTTGKCTDPDCISNPGLCKAGEKCDDKTRRCIKVTAVGDTCDAVSNCDVGSACIDLTLIGIAARSGSICTKACCESQTCPEGFICKMGTSGASVCVKGSDLMLPTGAGVPNAKCVKADDCRSGTCTNGFCLDGCCGSPNCGMAGTCSLKSDARFLCRNAVGTVQPGQSCDRDGDCSTGFCVGVSSWGPGRCSKHCCTSEDCPANWSCEDFTAGSAIVTACEPIPWATGTGSKRAGEACTGASQCRSNKCADGICSDSCCRDADCATGSFCRPRKQSDGRVSMRCVKP